MKPILFNTKMVKAILDGRKTVTRRLMKTIPIEQSDCLHMKFFNLTDETNEYACVKCGYGVQPSGHSVFKSPYQVGDILYVRETWNHNPLNEYGNEPEKYVYKASYDGHAGEFGWRPSLHMPKVAARIFLKVNSVRAERLQDIDLEGCKREGIKTIQKFPPFIIDDFAELWNSTVKKSDKEKYFWSANPWVWVIEFERISKENTDEESND